MNGLNGPKGNNFDESYVTQSMPYNTLRANNRFVQQTADWQVTRLAVMHGLYSGAVYGGGMGLGMAIYTRQMRYIPKYALYVGLPYAAFLGISTVYRMDV
mmetsp:Transcript_24687/g.33017  ORF Transcript_24687/g.33017 Transcript_24687/m.33017 type:complete len:100 (-) Transcript_24687:169-468(-)